MLKHLLLLCVCFPLWAGDSDLEDVNFPLNSTVVVDGFHGLDLLADVMNRHSNLELDVTGHTDSLGQNEYNKKLSIRRAEAVKAYLTSKGVSNAINVKGSGVDATHDNGTREGRFQNRRVSLALFEVVDGNRHKVSYHRLLELFFGGTALPKIMELNEEKNDAVMAKLTDLEKQQKALADQFAERMEEIEYRATAPVSAPDPHAHLSKQLMLGRYAGVSVGIGGDDNGMSAQIRGMYFKPVGENFAIQAQGDWSYFDEEQEGQVDGAFVYQHGAFKLAAAGSYKWVSFEHDLATARIGQAAVIADFILNGGKVGVYGTFPFADGDVLAEHTSAISTAFVDQQVINVPVTFGVDFAANLGKRSELTGHFGSIDSEYADADMSAGLGLDVHVNEHLVWYLDAQMNESHLAADDNLRYMTGLRFGSWNHAGHQRSEKITPVNIPRVRYEIISRTVRKGNNAPIANAGGSRSDVAAGTITLDGSASSDPEGDALSYEWRQTSGNNVAISNANAAVATFVGVAGETYQFELRVSDEYGDSATDSVTIAMEAAALPVPTISNFSAVPSTITEGEFTNLSWQTSDAATVVLSGHGEVSSTDSILLSPTETTTYTLTASNVSGDTTATVTVTVHPVVVPEPVLSFFKALPDTIRGDEDSTLTWSTVHAETVTISGIGEVPAAGSLTVSPDETTTYTITVTNNSGSLTSTATVTVIHPEPTIDFFSAAPSTIEAGGFTTLSWNTADTDEVVISGLGRVNTTGSIIVSPEETVTYTLTATNSVGSVTAQASVTVIPPNTAPVADAGPDQNVLNNVTTVTLNASGSYDPDGDALEYQWTQISGPAVTLTGADTATPSFTPQGGVYTFRVNVRDGRGGSDSDDVTVTVISVKSNPQSGL